MKRTDYSKVGEAEREIVIGMIVNDTVAGRAAAVWGDPPGPFAAPAWNTVGSWCVEHYRKYGCSLGRGVQSRYREWADGKRGDEADIIGTLLAHISEEFKRYKKEINPTYLTDLASTTFRKNRLRKALEAATADLDANRLDAAEATVTKYAGVDLSAGTGVDLFVDREAMLSTYTGEYRESLVAYEGGLKDFWGHMLGRDQFISFMAPEKTGKSWLMLDVAYRAMLNRKRVAYFQAGDLSEHQIKDRFLVRAARAPSLSTNEAGGWPCTVYYPEEITPPGPEDDRAEVSRTKKEFRRAFFSEKGWDEEIYNHVLGRVRSRNSYFKLKCYPSRTVSVSGIRDALESYALSGWIPDCVVIDYADVLAPVDRREDKIQQIGTTWQELRKLNQQLHCCLVTATQVNAASYSKRTLDRSNFSGNHLKLAEVTGMVGINVTAAEKDRGLMRLNWIARREGQFVPSRCVHVAGCLALSDPCVVSVYPKLGRKKVAK